ncbi:MAG: YgiT-type zinc finger protein [Planctomycetes bacterium]|nr:YgiT-type zinc finger protein [Planctomycetota bacterium]
MTKNGNGTENDKEETFVSQKVTYTATVDGRIILVENVPARVSSRTGERFFSPETVEQLQSIAWEKKTPFRVIETPVFHYPEALA